MERKFSKNICHSFVLAIAAALFIALSSWARSGERQYSENFSRARKLILVIIDYKSIFCPLCLEIFQDFCNTLHACSQEEFALGVLVYQETDNPEDRGRIAKIVEKQLKGLFIGNNIRFPFIYDKFHILEGMDLEGVSIILLDRSRMLLKKYALPLTPEQREEVFSF
jgi:hypothetical protein